MHKIQIPEKFCQRLENSNRDGYVTAYKWNSKTGENWSKWLWRVNWPILEDCLFYIKKSKRKPWLCVWTKAFTSAGYHCFSVPKMSKRPSKQGFQRKSFPCFGRAHNWTFLTQRQTKVRGSEQTWHWFWMSKRFPFCLEQKNWPISIWNRPF